jgi:hypothetical protein
MSLATWLAAAGAGSARADDDDSAELTARADSAQFTRIDTPNVVTRSLPGYRTDLTEMTYQRWVARGRADVGVGIGSVLLVDRPNGMMPGRYVDAGLTTSSGTLLMLGLRYRTTDRSSIYADATHVTGLGLTGEERVVGKVGIEFKAAKSDWQVAYGGLGFRLAGDTRMTLKPRRGGLGIYMRSTF